MTVRMNWREDAACGDADPDLFFPIGTTGNALRQIDEAKRICRFCPVHIQCLAWALENGVTDHRRTARTVVFPAHRGRSGRGVRGNLSAVGASS
jgi:hypothetical protein